MRRIFLFLIAVGFLLRATEAFRPIDASTYHAWRECDMGMIARNFWRGDMNLLRPQVDWGGAGPGYVESEFPLLPWLMALGYHAVGYHEALGRLLALLTSLASAWLFHRLARLVLVDEHRARLATLLFWFNPILVRFGTTIQPDPHMLLAALACAYGFLRWQRDGRTADWLLASLAGALAILLKASAAHLGLFLVLACLHRWGLRGSLRQGRLWALAAIMLAPPLLWYVHARGLWLTYGNSLGLSNDAHWLGPDLLRRQALLAHLLRVWAGLEVRHVYLFWGALLAALGLLRLRRGNATILFWLLGAVAFQWLILRTTSQTWAFYYHVLSVPPACLLMALGAVDPAAFVDLCRAPLATARRAPLRLAHAVLTLAVVAAFVIRGTATVDLVPPREGEGPHLRRQFEAAQHFRSAIPVDARVVTCGDNALHDETGAPIAHNESPLLFWLDRKGFTLTLEEQTPAMLDDLHARGARVVISRTDQPLGEYLQAHLRVIAREGDYLLAAW